MCASGELTVILITVWWLQRLGRDWQQVNKNHGNWDVERFNLTKLNEQEVMKLYQVKISNRFAVLEDFGDSEDINKAWENIKESIKSSAKESLGMHILKQHKPWFDDECVHLLDRRKQAKLRWPEDPNHSIAGNLNNVRLEASGQTFWEQKQGISES
jgi:hypothetical protein